VKILNTDQKMDAIFKETIFTMEVENFYLTEEEKNSLLDVLNGKISFHDKLQEYIENARRRGGAINVKS